MRLDFITLHFQFTLQLVILSFRRRFSLGFYIYSKAKSEERVSEWGGGKVHFIHWAGWGIGRYSGDDDDDDGDDDGDRVGMSYD